MGRAKTNVTVHFCLELLEMFERFTNNDSSQTVSDEGQLFEVGLLLFFLLGLSPISGCQIHENELLNFFGEIKAKRFNTLICKFFVAL
jgi:hypothetical protein